MNQYVKLRNMLKVDKRLISGLCINSIVSAILFVALLLYTSGFTLILFIVFAVANLIFLYAAVKCSYNSRMTCRRLEENGEIDDVLADFGSALTVKTDVEGRYALGEKYVFALGSGAIYPYSSVLWVYTALNRKNGTAVSQTLCMVTDDGKRYVLSRETANDAGTHRLGGYISLITSREPHCMTGFTAENKKRCKMMLKGKGRS